MKKVGKKSRTSYSSRRKVSKKKSRTGYGSRRKVSKKKSRTGYGSRRKAKFRGFLDIFKPNIKKQIEELKNKIIEEREKIGKDTSGKNNTKIFSKTKLNELNREYDKCLGGYYNWGKDMDEILKDFKLQDNDNTKKCGRIITMDRSKRAFYEKKYPDDKCVQKVIKWNILRDYRYGRKKACEPLENKIENYKNKIDENIKILEKKLKQKQEKQSQSISIILK